MDPTRSRHGLKVLLVTVPLILCSCHSLRDKEADLTAAGFRTVIPSTPAQTALVKSLPQAHLTCVQKNGQTRFLLADAAHHRLLIGNQSQYQAYQKLHLQRMRAGEALATASLNADAGAEWSNWGGNEIPYWGPEFNR